MDVDVDMCLAMDVHVIYPYVYLLISSFIIININININMQFSMLFYMSHVLDWPGLDMTSLGVLNWTYLILRTSSKLNIHLIMNSQ